jgi:TRAP-type C4-dicarboxylate transport system permease small subunit
MFSLLDKIETVFNRLTIFFAALVAVSIGLMAILIPLNLFLVKFHLGSMWWLFSSIEYALYFGVFAGAPWVLQKGAHVQVDVLTAALSKSASIKLDNIVNILGTALCLLLCFYGTRAGIAEFIDQTMPDKDLRISNWIIVSAFAISFFMLSIEFLFRMRKERILITGPDKAPADGGI